MHEKNWSFNRSCKYCKSYSSRANERSRSTSMQPVYLGSLGTHMSLCVKWCCAQSLCGWMSECVYSITCSFTCRNGFCRVFLQISVFLTAEVMSTHLFFHYCCNVALKDTVSGKSELEQNQFFIESENKQASHHFTFFTMMSFSTSSASSHTNLNLTFHISIFYISYFELFQYKDLYKV